MKIVGNFIKTIVREDEELIEWCFRVLKVDLDQPKPTSTLERMRKCIELAALRELQHHALILLQGMLAEHDLWKSRFFDVMHRADEYASVFEVGLPPWVTDPGFRSKSFTKYRDVTYEERNRLQQLKRREIVLSKATELGVDLDKIGIVLPRPADARDEDAIVRNREAERVKRLTTDRRSKQDQEEAKAEVEAGSETGLRLKLVTKVDENLKLKRRNAQLQAQLQKARDEGYAEAIAGVKMAKDDILIQLRDFASKVELQDEMIADQAATIVRYRQWLAEACAELDVIRNGKPTPNPFQARNRVLSGAD